MAQQGKGKSSKVVGLLGLLGAATAWYFLDPKKGAARRENFSKKAKDVYSQAETQVRRFGEEASKGFSYAVDKTGELARQGVEKVSDVSQTAVNGAKRIAEKAKNNS